MGALAAIVSFLGSFIKAGWTFAKWVAAQARLLYGQAFLIFNWWLRTGRHNILLRIVAWGAWMAAIEASFIAFSRIVVQPLASNLMSVLMPSTGSGILSLLWEHGANLQVAMDCVLALLGFWLTLEIALRQAARTAHAMKFRWVQPETFSR